MENEKNDSEMPTYSIKAINLNSKEKIVLVRQTTNKCINMSDTALLYIKGTELLLWNLELKRKTVYYKVHKDMSIIGISYNKNTSSLLLIQINFKTNEMFVKILNDRKQIIFCQKVKVNEMEMEGVIPILNNSNNFFVFSIQDKLYAIDSKMLELKLLSNKYDGYALKDRGVIYYKFITDERTEGFCIDLTTRQSMKIDDSLNEKIYNCVNSFLFTAIIENNFVPIYIICNKPYLWINNKWKISTEIVVYKDNNLIVKMPFEKDVVKENFFQWELLQQ